MSNRGFSWVGGCILIYSCAALVMLAFFVQLPIFVEVFGADCVLDSPWMFFIGNCAILNFVAKVMGCFDQENQGFEADSYVVQNVNRK